MCALKKHELFEGVLVVIKITKFHCSIFMYVHNIWMHQLDSSIFPQVTVSSK